MTTLSFCRNLLRKKPSGMSLSIEQWHGRYCEQARWTESLRAHFFSRPEIRRSGRILEVGCGTGAVSSSVALEIPTAKITGVDIDLPRLNFARSHDPAGMYAAGDGKRLPFPDRAFDLVFCHYLLLWVPSPEQVLREMARAVRPEGWVIALAEPDYSARIDYPPPLDELGGLQRRALRSQGADPDIGRKVATLFHECGLQIIETGILGARWTFPADQSSRQSEWDVLRSDLQGTISEERLEAFHRADQAAYQDGTRVLFLPTFYCLGYRKK
jgi:SAM-dependent methyltransferase